MNKKLHFKVKSKRILLLLLASLILSCFSVTMYAADKTNDNDTFIQQIKKSSVTLKVKNASLKSILYEIQKQTKINFIFNDEIIKNFPTKSVNIVGVSVQQALDYLLQKSELTYVIRENNISIVKKTVAIKPVERVTNVTINGKVIDKFKKPIPGVTILIKGTTKGAISNEDGQFSLVGQVGQLLQFTYVGMKELNKVITNDTKEIIYTMEEDVIDIEDIVITGMFNKAKESYTGAATFISKKELTDFKSRNLLRTIANVDPSFNIVENNAFGSNPNRLPEINIRGMANMPPVTDLKDAGLNGGIEATQSEQRTNLNTPLFILDGFEITLERMMDLDEEEIENVTILKDASSTAIYGSRGSNGVVVITSVKPQPGKLRVSLRATMNLEVPDLTSYNLLNSREKLELEKIAGYFIPEKNGYTPEYQQKEILENEYQTKLRSVLEGVDTYWLSQPLRTGLTGNYSLSLSGGDRSFRYSLSASYNSQAGVMKGSERNNFNGGLTISYLFKSLQFTNTVNVGLNNSAESMYGSFSKYTTLNPYYTPYDKKGDMVMEFQIPQGSGLLQTNNNLPTGEFNPMYDATTTSYNKKNYTNLRNGTSIEWAPVKTVKIGGRFGFSQNSGETHNYKSSEHSQFRKITDVTKKGTYDLGMNKSVSWDASLNLSYAEVFDKHSIFFGVNGEMRESSSENYFLSTVGFTHEKLDFISMASGYAGENPAPGGSESTKRAMGLTFNVNYNWNRTLFVDASYRLDGASTFGSFSRFKPFYSVGAGWTVTGMKFMEENVKFINNLRFKYNYGVTGSLPFEVYDALTTFEYNTKDRYEGLIGANLKGYGNPNLTWQYTYSHNLGVELSVLNGRISFNGNIYKRLTKGSITTANLTLSHGFETYKENQGDIENKGYDAGISLRLINSTRNQIRWNVSFNVAGNANKLVKLSSAMKAYNDELLRGPSSEPFMMFKEGESMNALYLMPSLGIDPASGRELLLKRDGTVTFEYERQERVVVGLNQPKLDGRINTTFSYKRLNISLGFSIKLGGQYYNSTLVSKVENADPRNNVDRRVFDDRWRGVNHYAKYKGLRIKENNGQTSRFMQNQSELKCGSINISYALSSKWLKKNIGLESVNLSANSSELFQISTIKNERGTNFPFSRKIAFSVGLTF